MVLVKKFKIQKDGELSTGKKKKPSGNCQSVPADDIIIE